MRWAEDSRNVPVSAGRLTELNFFDVAEFDGAEFDAPSRSTLLSIAFTINIAFTIKRSQAEGEVSPQTTEK